MLRLILLTVAVVNFYSAYLFFFTPQILSDLLGILPTDNVHQYLTMSLGALLMVFGLGALLPLVRPRRYGSIIIMLLLSHFMIFLIDVIVLSRSQMPWKALAPQMVYLLIVSTALVRWYPLREKENGEMKKEKEEVIEEVALEKELVEEVQEGDQNKQN